MHSFKKNLNIKNKRHKKNMVKPDLTLQLPVLLCNHSIKQKNKVISAKILTYLMKGATKKD